MTRGEYVGVDDAERLRTSFDMGSEWTRERATRSWNWNERRFRRAVADLRKQGYPVISVSEQGSVYRKARSRAEVEDFVARELISRTRELEEQTRALRDGCDKHFGSDQLALAL